MEGREEGKDERGAHGWIESRSGAEFLILLNANREIASATTFGARRYCAVRAQKTSVIRLAVQISH